MHELSTLTLVNQIIFVQCQIFIVSNRDLHKCMFKGLIYIVYMRNRYQFYSTLIIEVKRLSYTSKTEHIYHQSQLCSNRVVLHVYFTDVLLISRNIQQCRLLIHVFRLI